MVTAPDRRLPGVLRRMFYAPGRSSARCHICRRDLCVRVSPRQAGRAGRDHARDTGHPVRVVHVQVVVYEREQ